MSENPTEFTWVEPESKTYEEMMAEAKKIHPDAIVRIGDDECTWEIVIKTKIEENRFPETVDPSWAGTPAETAYREHESSYGNSLERWAHKNGHGSAPLSIVAAHYNLDVEEWRLSDKIHDEKLEEFGLSEWSKLFYDSLEDPSIEVPDLDDEQNELLTRARKESWVEARQALWPKREEIDDRS